MLGIDVLKPLGGMISLKDDTLIIHDETRATSVKLHEENATEAIISSQCGDMPQASNKRYKDLPWKYREIFTTRPGRISCYIWQIPFHSESEKCIAFLYKGRCYEHNETPFGRKPADQS